MSEGKLITVSHQHNLSEMRGANVSRQQLTAPICAFLLFVFWGWFLPVFVVVVAIQL